MQSDVLVCQTLIASFAFRLLVQLPRAGGKTGLTYHCLKSLLVNEGK